MAKAKSKSRKARHGVVTIVRNKSKKSSETEFYSEQKPGTYKVAQYRGKIALIGGESIEGESPLETLSRELSEEMTSKDAAKIIARKAKFYKTAIVKVSKDDPAFKLFIYEAVIDNPYEWEAVKMSHVSGDGGYTSIRPAKSLGDDRYAFGYDRIVQRYLQDKLGMSIPFHYEPLARFSLN